MCVCRAMTIIISLWDLGFNINACCVQEYASMIVIFASKSLHVN
jgi:hypothetical protein